MSYPVNQSDGTLLTNVSDQTLEATACSLVLIGKKVAGYGEALNENFVHLLENFSNAAPPVAPMRGQLWYNSEKKELSLYNGETWIRANSSVISDSTPISSDAVGDTWWDTAKQKFSIWNGTEWVTIGPANVTVGGLSGLVADTIVNSNDLTEKLVLILYITDTPVVVISKETVSYPTLSFGGVPVTIKPGVNLLNIAHFYNGVAEDSARLNGVSASNYLRSDSPISLTLPLTSSNRIIAQNIKVGTNVISVADGLGLSLNYGRVSDDTDGVAALAIDNSGKVTVSSHPVTALGVATKQYVDNKSGGTSVANNWEGLQTFGEGLFRIANDVNSPTKTFSVSLASSQPSVVMNIPASVSSFTPAQATTVGSSGITMASGKRLGRAAGGSGAIQELFPDLPVGAVSFFAGKNPPNANWLACNGAAISRTVYAELFAYIVKSFSAAGAALISSANPGIVTWTGHGLIADDPVRFTTTGTLPTNILVNTEYYVRTVTNANQFTISATPGGPEINTSAGSNAGTHTVWYAPHGLGDLSSTFNVPTYAAGHFGVDFADLTPFIKATSS